MSTVLSDLSAWTKQNVKLGLSRPVGAPIIYLDSCGSYPVIVHPASAHARLDPSDVWDDQAPCCPTCMEEGGEV